MARELIARLALEKNEFRFSHALGQNFILDDGLIARLVDAAELPERCNVLEVGPGAGTMSAELLERGANLLAFELDRRLEPLLREVLEPYAQRVTLVFEDVLKADLAEKTRAAFGGEPFHVVANLPYYITADVILRLLTSALPIRSITVMVQREAAQRMMAKPGEKAYCALAATVQYFAAPRVVMHLPPEVFTPRPHVDSCLMRLELHDPKPVSPRDEALFLKLISVCFAMRRKTLANNLTSALGMPRERALSALAACGLNPQVRGEALSLRELCQLSDSLPADVLK